jgi:hypothetical protein
MSACFWRYIKRGRCNIYRLCYISAVPHFDYSVNIVIYLISNVLALIHYFIHFIHRDCGE